MMYHSFTASEPNAACARTVARTSESLAMYTSWDWPGRLSQWSMVESSGPAAAMRGARGSSATRRRNDQVQGYPPTSNTDVTPEHR
jgi:hypothetical protein